MNSFYDSPTKGQALHNVFHGSFEDMYPQMEEDEISFKLKYLRRYWPELANNQLFIEKYRKYRDSFLNKVHKTLVKLIKLYKIDELDVVGFMSASTQGDLYKFIGKCFPDRICIDLYYNVEDKNKLVKKMESIGCPMNLIGAIVMAGDRKTFKRLLKKLKHSSSIDVLFNIVYVYFISAAYNKEVLKWITDGVFASYPSDDIVGVFCDAVDEYPETLKIAREAFDAFRYDSSPEYYSMRISNHISIDHRLNWYEILFQTGYFPYSYFTDVLPRTPELEQWLLLSTNV